MKETESLISELLLSSENYFNETFFKIVILSFPLMKKRRSVTFISYCYSPTLTYLGSLRISCMLMGACNDISINLDTFFVF